MPGRLVGTTVGQWSVLGRLGRLPTAFHADAAGKVNLRKCPFEGFAGKIFHQHTSRKLDLIANDDPDLTPAGTVYRVTETVPTHDNPAVYYIDVPVSPGGPYWARDIIAEPPTDLAAAHELQVPEGTIVGRLVGSPGIEAITLADLKAALDALP